MESEGREALARWEAERPENFYEAAPNLGRVLRAHLDGDVVAALEPRLRAFGAAVAQVVEPAAQTLMPARSPARPVSFGRCESMARPTCRLVSCRRCW